MRYQTTLIVNRKRPQTATERTRKRRNRLRGHRLCRECGDRPLHKYAYRCDVCQAVENMRMRIASRKEK